MYNVVSYKASIAHTGSGEDVAAALQQIIERETANGWEFVQVQELTTHVAGNMGCFGLGATPSFDTSLAILIFKK